MMRRTVVVLLAAAAVLAVLIGPASAGSSRFIHDPRHDVGGSKSYFTARQKAATDLTRVHYWMTAHRFKIRFTVRNLRRGVDKPFVLLLTKNDSLEFEWDPGAPPFVQRSGEDESCTEHSSRRLDYAHDYIQITFPKRCFPKHRKFSAFQAYSGMETVPQGMNVGLIIGDNAGRA